MLFHKNQKKKGKNDEHCKENNIQARDLLKLNLIFPGLHYPENKKERLIKHK